MYFTSQLRHNPLTGEDECYYRLKESFRDATGLARNRIVMNIGFMTGLSHEDIRDVGRGLNYRKEHRGEGALWGDEYVSLSEASRLRSEASQTFRSSCSGCANSSGRLPRKFAGEPPFTVI